MSEYKWIAQDEDGKIFKYKRQPRLENVWLLHGGHDYQEKGKSNPNWRDSLINLETHDYKIEDGILMKVELQRGDKDVNAMKSYLQSRNKHPEVIFKGSELQYKDRNGKWNNCSYDEYRIKPKTVKFRNYLNTHGLVTTTYDESIEKMGFFVKWIGDWQEVSLDEPEQQWPTELVARIAKIDLQAAEWLRDNWEVLEGFSGPYRYKKTNAELNFMFVWRLSPQGYDYWDSISEKLGE